MVRRRFVLRVKSVLWVFLAFVFCAGAAGAAEEVPFHIGIMTETSREIGRASCRERV